MKYLIGDINKYRDSDIKLFVDSINSTKKEQLMNVDYLTFKQNVVGEILLAKLLLEMNINYQTIKVHYNDYGKPYILNYPVYYNISYHNNYVICAINTNQIGISIKRIDNINKKDAKVFCTNDEYNFIKNKYDYYKIYTLKKAYIKLFGQKLNDIKSLNIVYDNKIRLNVINKTFTYEDYMISICYLSPK